MNEYEITISGKDTESGDSVKLKILVDTQNSLWDVAQAIRGRAQRIASQAEIDFPQTVAME